MVYLPMESTEGWHFLKLLKAESGIDYFSTPSDSIATIPQEANEVYINIWQDKWVSACTTALLYLPGWDNYHSPNKGKEICLLGSGSVRSNGDCALWYWSFNYEQSSRQIQFRGYISPSEGNYSGNPVRIEGNYMLVYYR